MTLEELAALQQEPAGPDMTEVQRRPISDEEVEHHYNEYMRKQIRSLQRDVPRFY